MSQKILITPRSLTAEGHESLSLFTQAGYEVLYCTKGRTPSTEELLQLIPDCVGWLAGVEPVSPQVIASAKKLRAISRNGVGIDNLPLQELQQRNIPVLRVEGVLAQSVAELAIGLMFSALRQIPMICAGIKAGRWERPKGQEFAGKTVGVIGYGNIGSHLAHIASVLNAHVLVCDPFLENCQYQHVPLKTLLEKSDLISLHCPALTKTLIDQEALQNMKQGTVLINTARAQLVDPDAVLDALKSGKLACYATDVYEQEPPATSDLIQHPHCITTSHIAGSTQQSFDKVTRHAVHNLLNALSNTLQNS